MRAYKSVVYASFLLLKKLLKKQRKLQKVALMHQSISQGCTAAMDKCSGRR